MHRKKKRSPRTRRGERLEEDPWRLRRQSEFELLLKIREGRTADGMNSGGLTTRGFTAGPGRRGLATGSFTAGPDCRGLATGGFATGRDCRGLAARRFATSERTREVEHEFAIF